MSDFVSQIELNSSSLELSLLTFLTSEFWRELILKHFPTVSGIFGAKNLKRCINRLFSVENAGS